VNDYVPRPVDPGELAARTRTQIRRKRYADYLRQTVEASLEMAAADPLTSLHNRRYLETHLGALLGQTRQDRLPLCAPILDLDDFKSVNDRHGHGAGDQVLQTFAARAKRIIRGTDILCRLGGDEFVIIMPGTSLRTGYGVAEEIRAATASETFALTPGGREILVTASAGLAESADDSPSGSCAARTWLSTGRNRMDAIAFRWIAPGRPPRNGWQAACNLGKAAADINE
jgi:two-component system cell cycle response regulator